MSHLPELITDLSIILVAAGIISIIFKKLRQPLLLGYILVGFLVGPNFELFPTVTETTNIKVWSEIGVIFLLFSLGLEFSFKKLIKQGAGISVTALLKIALTMALGYLAGQLMGWGTMDSIFLGGLLSISSTTIAIKSFEDLGVKGQRFTGMVVGILIIEDLVAILLLVMLSTIAISQEVAGMQMVFSILKLVFFLIMCFVIGIFIIPSFFKWTKKWMNDETLLIFSLGLCLIMVYTSTAIGFSPELGAFVMGSILAETVFAEKIEHLIKHVKNLFGAIFFVSVGMLINPLVIWENITPVIVISMLTIFGKFIISSVSATVAGQPLKSSVQIGASLAQIGEFSFIIAALGLSLKVTSDFLYPIAVAVSAISALAAPYMIKSSEGIFIGISKLFPKRVIKAMDRYSMAFQAIKSESKWRKLRNSYIRHIVILSAIILSVMFIAKKFVVPILISYLGNGFWGRFISELLPFVVVIPFIWALAFRNVNIALGREIWDDKRYRALLVLYRLVRIALALFYMSLWISRSFSYTIAMGIVIFSVIIIGLFSRRIQGLYTWIETKFMLNYYEKDKLMNTNENLTREQLSPWDAHMADFIVPQEWEYNGKSLLELQLRERFGINIAVIQRGSKLITAPKRNEVLYPFDKIYIIGTDKQVEKFSKFLITNSSGAEGVLPNEITLNRLQLDMDCKLIGVSIRDSGVREKSDALIVGIERNGRRILNPDSGTTFELDDVVWIVGNKKHIETLFSGKAIGA